MLNLIKLEIKKFKLKGTIKGVIITNIILIGFMCLILLTSKNQGETPFKDFGQLLLLNDSVIRITFIIYASIMLSKLVIDEFKNKTINVMFTYPIARKKILVSKLLIVSAFTFVCIISSNIVSTLILNCINKYNHILPTGLTLSVITNNTVPIFINAIAASGMALIPLFFGMRKKSTPATIVSAVILVCIVCSVCSNNGDVSSLTSILPLSLAIGLVGILTSYFTIRKIETVDVN